MLSFSFSVFCWAAASVAACWSRCFCTWVMLSCFRFSACCLRILVRLSCSFFAPSSDETGVFTLATSLIPCSSIDTVRWLFVQVKTPNIAVIPISTGNAILSIFPKLLLFPFWETGFVLLVALGFTVDVVSCGRVGCAYADAAYFFCV